MITSMNFVFRLSLATFISPPPIRPLSAPYPPLYQNGLINSLQALIPRIQEPYFLPTRRDHRGANFRIQPAPVGSPHRRAPFHTLCRRTVSRHPYLPARLPALPAHHALSMRNLPSQRLPQRRGLHQHPACPGRRPQPLRTSQ